MNWTWVSCIAGRFFTIWNTRKSYIVSSGKLQIQIGENENTHIPTVQKTVLTSFYVNLWNLENFFISYQA